MKRPIRIALAGVGNCASSLIQGIEHYRRNAAGGAGAIGLMHWEIQGLTPADIEVVAAFDIDRRKVGRPLHEALFAKPNCTKTIVADMPPSPVIVKPGPVLDGVAPHMKDYDEDKIFLPADRAMVERIAGREKAFLAHEAAAWQDYLENGSWVEA